MATADEERDADLAAGRLDGAALAARTTNYTLRAKLDDQPALPAIPAKPLEILLPEAFEGWPRTFFAVVEDPESGVATIMSATQQDAWSDYKLSYIANLVADASLNVAPPYLGAKQVQPDSPFLLIPPQDLAAAYADVLDKGDDSEYADLFDAETDSFRAQIASDRAQRLEDFNKTGAKTGKLSFSADAGTQAPVALATLDSGAIVAVTVNESDTVTPTNDDAVIKVDGNPVVKTLAGVTQSATGFTTTFADQLFFFVPAESSSERIRFLGLLLRHPRSQGGEEAVTDPMPGAVLRGAVDLTALRTRASQPATAPAENAPAPALVFDVTDATFPQVLELSRSVPVVIDLWAEWCGPCKQLSPVLEKVVTELGGQLVLAKVDVDANPQIAQGFRAQSIPMVVALVAGQPVPLFTGAVPEQQVRDVFAQLLQLAAQHGVTGTVPVGEAPEPGGGARAPAPAPRGVRRDRGR